MRLEPQLRENGERDARYTLVLAHGAGLGMDAPFLARFAAGLAARGAAAGGIRVVRFEFAYMQRSRALGRRRAPDPLPRLLERYHEVLDALALEPARLLVGGKSLGGRVASHLVEGGVPAAGLVCLGYPFHPPGRPERTRTAHLARLATPTLICQGTRDRLGSAEEVVGYELAAAIRVVWLPDGDHDWVPRKCSGFAASDHVATALGAVVDFVAGLGGSAPARRR